MLVTIINDSKPIKVFNTSFSENDFIEEYIGVAMEKPLQLNYISETGTMLILNTF